MQRRGYVFDIVVLLLVITSGVALMIVTMTTGRRPVPNLPRNSSVVINSQLESVYPAGTDIAKEQQESEGFRRQTNANLIVSILDREFQFSSRQREELAAAIGRKWESKWDNFPEALQANPSPIPKGLAGIVEPRLTVDQKRLWQAPWRIDAKGRKVMGIVRELGPVIRAR